MRRRRERRKSDIERKRKADKANAVKLWQRCEANVHSAYSGSPVEGKTAVWPARTASARDKNDKYFMRPFEDGGFIIVGLRPRHSLVKI